eukprot:CAMPEP_0202866646 /NCGR_PEP_ID=MMETSP1391-20130828/8247_1 /ASSEMBLY_ACC=CAM_ASM_000867 /TAXON_ID=1034604 /ORGANISM="Chlamydomonas leiostraca, Strain SAG 11-49" /LENGTH=572 /DNA_ID=CAMNT_0049546615 /DNA_START=102 /DNA_END=1820 /DNA_ORIENTATION=-
MATQAVSEEPHCWSVRDRWKEYLVDEAPADAIAVVPVSAAELEQGVNAAEGVAKSWASVAKFKAKAGELLVVPSASGSIDRVLLGTGDSGTLDLWAYAGLPTKLPAGTFKLQLPQRPAPAAAADAPAAGAPAAPAAAPAGALSEPEKALLGWALGCYAFDRYKSDKNGEGAASRRTSQDGSAPSPGASPGSSTPGADKGPRIQAKLAWPAGADRSGQGASLAGAYYWARDMINTPAEDLGPQHLAAEAAAMAAAYGASCTIIQGDDLLREGYPAIHTVGRAAARPPALIDIRWAPQGTPVAAYAPGAARGAGAAEGSGVGGLPYVALVGKGVCFDSGGLDIKGASGMRLMKKDMGGAALILALAHMAMASQLRVQLRVLVPTVENAISGNAYRPLDVLRTRAGITVENGNTDAEGRLILCDALHEAATSGPSGPPDLLLDAATLTGAARAALGPDLPATFASCDATWAQLAAAAAAEGDNLWRLPLYAPYRKMIDSKVADTSSTGGEGAQGGAILAALYLEKFTKPASRWVHIDTPAWTAGAVSCSGRPEGGEANALRAVWRFLQARYNGAA